MTTSRPTYQTAASKGLKALYHFQRFSSDRLVQTVRDGMIYCSSPSAFNDPWDCKPWFNKGLDDPIVLERQVRWFDAVGRKHTPGLSEAERQRRVEVLRRDRGFLDKMIDDASAEIGVAMEQRYRVYCLSTQPLSTLMWSHYAENHHGICLEFGVQNLTFCGALKVAYGDEYPLFDLAADDDYGNLLPLLAKSAEWEYEDEYRLVAQEESNAVDVDTLKTQNGLLRLPREALKAVILGCMAPPSTVVKVKEMVEGSGTHVELRQAVRDPFRYRVVIHPLN